MFMRHTQWVADRNSYFSKGALSNVLNVVNHQQNTKQNDSAPDSIDIIQRGAGETSALEEEGALIRRK